MIRHIMPWKADGPGDVTLLSAPGRRLAKLITPTEIVEYQGALLFQVDALRLDGIDDVEPLLQDLAGRTDTCPIRGVLKQEFATRAKVLRRIHDAPSARPGHVIVGPFTAAPRCWAMVDLEPEAAPPWIDPTDPVIVGGWLRRQLPACFRMARGVVQLSNTAGVKRGPRAHLWFWLSQALVKADLDRLLGAVPGVDVSIYQPVGIHYTAEPVFEDVDDPCAIHGRLAVLPGFAEVAVPPLPEPARRPVAMPAEARAYARPRRGLSGRSTGPERYMIRCLQAIAEAPPGARHPTIVRISTRLFGLAKGGALDRAEVSARVQGAVALSSFDRDHAEVISALRWAWTNARPWSLP